MERIGIFGGTFNPPHIGHIQAAEQAVKALGLDRLILIPDGVAPHKTLPENSPTAWQRLDMLRLAAEGKEKIEVSDLELCREGISYTVDTVAALRKDHPEDELILLMGTDMFLCFEQWRNWQEILSNVSLGVFYRGDHQEESTIGQQKEKLDALGAKVYLVENDVLAISSTQLRRLLAFHSAGEFLPQGVEDYIFRNGLYDVKADWKNLPMEKLEQVVVSLLKPNRVAHVLGCRDTAVELAKRWGADETDAARAGILHDITKALDGPLQLTLCRAHGTILSEFSKEYPKTLHALTGSVVAERIFGENEAVVSAIRYHTTGKANMTLLQTIIYVADYMEPNRDFPGVEKLREMAFTDIWGALRMGLEMTMEHLKRQGNAQSPESKEALEFLNARIESEGEKLC